jgi:hypothetical protein
MIEALALIVTAYAVARLLNEYMFVEPGMANLRLVVAGIALLAIVFGFYGVHEAATSVSNLIP